MKKRNGYNAASFFLISENQILYIYMIVVRQEELSRYDFGHKRLILNGSERRLSI